MIFKRLRKALELSSKRRPKFTFLLSEGLITTLKEVALFYNQFNYPNQFDMQFIFKLCRSLLHLYELETVHLFIKDFLNLVNSSKPLIILFLSTSNSLNKFKISYDD